MSRNSFGRLPAPPDARDLKFRMVTAMPQIKEAVPPTPRKLAYRDGPLLDQGDMPYCVGYSCRGFLDAAPIMSTPQHGPSATQIYREAQEVDEWPGTDYDGTSVRAGMKALKSLGHISSYVWGQTVEEAIAWMNGGYGTVIVGTDWYAEMSEVDSRSKFMLQPSRSMSWPIGGHAWRWIWYDKKVGGILCRNSWGNDFGWPLKENPSKLSGYCYISVDFAQWLLNRDGEIAAPTQVKVKPIPVVTR